jgi:hypothetical protein
MRVERSSLLKKQNTLLKRILLLGVFLLLGAHINMKVEAADSNDYKSMFFQIKKNLINLMSQIYHHQETPQQIPLSRLEDYLKLVKNKLRYGYYS